MTNRTDSFDRADSSSSLGTPSDGGSGYTVTGTWGISSNAAYLVSVTSQAVAFLSSGTSDVDVQVTFSSVVGSPDIGVAFRCTDSSNHLLLAANSSGWRLYKKIAGAFTQLGSTYGTAPASADVAKVTASGTSITAYVNGVSRITATESAQQTATSHGLRSNTDMSCRFNDFSVTDLISAAASLVYYQPAITPLLVR